MATATKTKRVWTKRILPGTPPLTANQYRICHTLGYRQMCLRDIVATLGMNAENSPMAVVSQQLMRLETLGFIEVEQRAKQFANSRRFISQGWYKLTTAGHAALVKTRAFYKSSNGDA
jgi:hypothetical protein